MSSSPKRSPSVPRSDSKISTSSASSAASSAAEDMPKTPGVVIKRTSQQSGQKRESTPNRSARKMLPSEILATSKKSSAAATAEIQVAAQTPFAVKSDVDSILPSSMLKSKLQTPAAASAASAEPSTESRGRSATPKITTSSTPSATQVPASAPNSEKRRRRSQSPYTRQLFEQPVEEQANILENFCELVSDVPPGIRYLLTAISLGFLSSYFFQTAVVSLLDAKFGPLGSNFFIRAFMGTIVVSLLTGLIVYFVWRSNRVAEAERLAKLMKIVIINFLASKQNGPDSEFIPVDHVRAYCLDLSITNNGNCKEFTDAAVLVGHEEMAEVPSWKISEYWAYIETEVSKDARVVCDVVFSSEKTLKRSWRFEL